MLSQPSYVKKNNKRNDSWPQMMYKNLYGYDVKDVSEMVMILFKYNLSILTSAPLFARQFFMIVYKYVLQKLQIVTNHTLTNHILLYFSGYTCVWMHFKFEQRKNKNKRKKNKTCKICAFKTWNRSKASKSE